MSNTDKYNALDGDVLRELGAAIAPDWQRIRDADGHWWTMAWSEHLGRWESSASPAERILRLATTKRRDHG